MMENGPISVLVAPLDWGLGHATRCIPIIKELILHGVRVIIAANPAQKTLLKSEFPQIEFEEPPGYKIRYSGGVLLKWALLFQIPSLLKQRKRENRWLDHILRQHQIDAIISDNRYGLFNKRCISVFITHQLQIKSGVGASDTSLSNTSFRNHMGRWADRQLLKWNFAFIQKFSCCWIPDQDGILSAAGLLSHPPTLPTVPVKYIGILSRFDFSEKKIRQNRLLIILSGPEPQRTEFENILFSQLTHTTMSAVVLRGLPGTDLPAPYIREDIKIWNHLPSDALNELLNNSEYIIARSGYSTIMDLLTVKKNAILVPTPGQTEQEYLGKYMHEKKWMYSVAQKNFHLETTINAFEKAELVLPEIPCTNLNDVIKTFLQELSLQKKNRGNETKSFKG
jgi:hypothetical protein